MGAAPGESPRDAEGCRSMNGRCPASGLVRLRGERQGAGAWAAPGPLHPLPRLGPRYCVGRAGARAARRLRRTPPDRRAQWMGKGGITMAGRSLVGDGCAGASCGKVPPVAWKFLLAERID